ncbi:MAG TPA: type II toxin-antitoxin system VapC family toxin [Terriglobales bacterium]|nr:type II toxin-antitoxin system VapC family toxin [Terriglobales bacterium]
MKGSDLGSRFLLDTNICIYIRQNRPDSLLRRFDKLRPGEAAISVITYGELMFGAHKSLQSTSALVRLRDFAVFVPALPLPEFAAETYGKIRADLQARGEMIGNNDLWIAAHALCSNLTLVTNNEREFRRVKNLKIENWAA